VRRLVALIVLALPAVAATGPETLGALFPLRAGITTEGAGLCRLELPAEVIDACLPDFADLRILNPGGREIPYVVDNPVLVFSLPGQSSDATLYFGGGRAHRPQYDLEALDPGRLTPTAGETAPAALAVLDPARANAAELGEIERNPGYDPAPVLAFAIHPGAELDRSPYSHLRRLRVAPSAEGLARIRLQPEDLAILRPDLADLRIVDANGHQWAYLRQRSASAAVVQAEIAAHETEDHVSRYQIEIPSGPLTIHRVDLEVAAPYYDRDFTLTGLIDGDTERVLASGRLVRQVGDSRPATVASPPTRVTGLRLEVVDGDDAPLVFGRVEVQTRVPDLYMAAEKGDFDLLLGFPEAEAPVYELERVRSMILAVPAAEVAASDLEPNPDYDSSRRLFGSSSTQKLALWIALSIAVVVLVTLTYRAARQESRD
jgi:hypothetical protein